MHADVPAFESVKSGWASTEGVLLDRHGQPIHELRVVERGRRLDWVPLDAISPAAVEAIVRAEDKRFFKHSGVDWLALSDAALDTLFSRPRGASTISMQVAAQLDQELMPKSSHRSLGQKWDQIKSAQALEKSWTKRQILEAYLNLSTFRGELQGVAAAANGLFAKHPSGVTDGEGLLLAALLRGPNAGPEQAGKRACAIAAAMESVVPCQRIVALAHQALNGAPNVRPAVDLAPHVARALLTHEHPRVQSTLDGAVQRFALDTLQRHLADLADRAVADGAVLVADNRSGEVLAINEELATKPEKLNEDPHGAAWLLRIRLSNPSELRAVRGVTPGIYLAIAPFVTAPFVAVTAELSGPLTDTRIHVVPGSAGTACGAGAPAGTAAGAAAAGCGPADCHTARPAGIEVPPARTSESDE